jgi:hypothetical protein
MNSIARFETVDDFLIPNLCYEDTLSYMKGAVKKVNDSLSDSKMLYKEFGEEYKAIYSSNNARYFPISSRRIRITTFVSSREWQLVGILEKDNGDRKSFKNINGRDAKLPPFFKDCKFECDCCKNIGSRKYLYVIQNRESGWMKKVGYECLNTITKAKLTADINAIHKIYDELHLAENSPNKNTKELYPIRMILRLSIQLVDKYGYVKEGERTTKDMIYKMVSSSPNEAQTLANELGIQGPYERIDKSIDDKVDRVWKYNSVLSDSYKSDYEKQIHETMNKYKSVPFNKIGLIASVYRKSI